MKSKTIMADKNLYKNWHLAATEHDVSTTEFEWSLLRFHEAFKRFCLQLASICGLGSLAYEELIIIHVIRMQDRPKPVTIIARLLNRDDIPNIQYSLRKLISLGLIVKEKEISGKLYNYSLTQEGRDKVDRYAKYRATLLTEQTATIDKIDEKLVMSSKLISLLTGIYDEAGRISATYSLVDEI